MRKLFARNASGAVIAAAAALLASSPVMAQTLTPPPFPQFGAHPAAVDTAASTSASTTPVAAVGKPGAPGVPFPQLLGEPSPALPGEVKVPLASTPISMDQPHTDKTLDSMTGQVDTRLDDLKVGSGDMSSPDTSGYSSELDAMAEQQREIRLLTLKQTRADLAMKLWATTFDPRRENAAAAKADKAGDDASASTDSTSGAAVDPSLPGLPSSSSAAQSANPTAPALTAAQAAAQQAAADAAAQAALPMPVTVSITGNAFGAPLVATILVPYVGEVSAKVGTRLPGHRRVIRVSPDAVEISDPVLGTVPLSFGSSVALSPPALVAPINGMANPGSQRLPLPIASGFAQ
jgi:type IV pilus biogenesis protein PilP